jgi:hypothetical protein
MHQCRRDKKANGHERCPASPLFVPSTTTPQNGGYTKKEQRSTQAFKVAMACPHRARPLDKHKARRAACLPPDPSLCLLLPTAATQTRCLGGRQILLTLIHSIPHTHITTGRHVRNKQQRRTPATRRTVVQRARGAAFRQGGLCGHRRLCTSLLLVLDAGAPYQHGDDDNNVFVFFGDEFLRMIFL